MNKIIEYGTRNVKVAVQAADGNTWDTPFSVPYAKGIQLPATVNEQDVYANDTRQLRLISDQGYAGNAVFSARDTELETALGYMTKNIDSGGIAEKKANGYIPVCYYYETKIVLNNKKVVTGKNWLLNVNIGKSELSAQGQTENINLTDVQYPLTVFGLAKQTATGTEAYRDADGFEEYIVRIFKVPGDAGYATFGDTVPIPKHAEITP